MEFIFNFICLRFSGVVGIPSACLNSLLVARARVKLESESELGSVSSVFFFLLLRFRLDQRL